MDYKDTLNLPSTSFSMRAKLVSKEPERLKKWEEMDLYNFIQKKMEGADDFILHDGPPYANGDIHLGTAMNKILKDFIVKYKTMRGYNSPYIPGWDTHGLPIEQKVMTNLGKKAKEKSKDEIRKLCREYASKFVSLQREQFKRLGVRGDWEHPYLTYNTKYEANVLRVLGGLVEKGNVYRNKKPIYWCTSCETALAEAEVEYQDDESYSIYVKFQDKEDPAKYYIIWTTTPWTLPANVAIALHPSYEYAEVKVGEEKWIMAKDLVKNVMEKAGIENYEVVEVKKGNEYEGKKALHPFMDRDSLIVNALYVDLETGSGCVHTAPGHGADDYITGLKYDLPILAPVDEQGNFTAEAGKDLEGLFVFKGNEVVNEKLKKSGHLVALDTFKHSYPHCWRCHKPIIFRATEQWFISIDKNDLRKKTLEAVKSTKWFPKWGETRIFSMISERPDWCISRQRSWGIPIPAVKCKKCGKVHLTKEIVDFYADKVEEFGADIWFEWKPKELLPSDFKCDECGENDFELLEDILDVWIDSGSSYKAVVQENPALRFPADVYIEGSDQHRGWFNSSLTLSVGNEGIAPFKAVITHGYVNDEKGHKMSKSMRNTVAPKKINERYGADILRLWVASTNYQEDVRASDSIIKQQTENYKKIRNTLRYLIGNLEGFDADKVVPFEDMMELDKWAMIKINELVKAVTYRMENYEFYRMFQTVMKFLITDMSAFYLDILKDRLYCEGKNSIERRSAQTVLLKLLEVITKILTPILTFTSEEVYEYFPEKMRKYETIQLEKWPEYDENILDLGLLEKYERINKLREDVLKALEMARNEKKIGNPLDANVKIKIKDEKIMEDLKTLSMENIADIFIVSGVELSDNVSQYEGSVAIIDVEFSEGEKCERCWKYSKETGKNESFPATCPRCSKVLENNE